MSARTSSPSAHRPIFSRGLKTPDSDYFSDVCEPCFQYAEPAHRYRIPFEERKREQLTIHMLASPDVTNTIDQIHPDEGAQPCRIKNIPRHVLIQHFLPAFSPGITFLAFLSSVQDRSYSRLCAKICSIQICITAIHHLAREPLCETNASFDSNSRRIRFWGPSGPSKLPLNPTLTSPELSVAKSLLKLPKTDKSDLPHLPALMSEV